jgi:hypothetical protein
MIYVHNMISIYCGSFKLKEQKNFLSLLFILLLLLLLVRPITGHKGPDGGVELQLYAFFNLGAGWRWVINPTPRPLYPGERSSIPIVQEVGWDPGSVWMGAKNLALTGIRSPEHPSCSESLLLLLILLLKFKNIFDKERNSLLWCEINLYSSANIHHGRRAPKCLSLLIFFPITTVATSLLTSTCSPLTRPPQK